MDARVRKLLAAWQGSGSPDDEAAYLNARIQEGSLGKEALRVAAWVGDEVAREVGRTLMGDAAVALKPPKSGVANFLIALPGGPPVWFRATEAGLEHRLSLVADIEEVVLDGFSVGSEYLQRPTDSGLSEVVAATQAIFAKQRGPTTSPWSARDDLGDACAYFLGNLTDPGRESSDPADWDFLGPLRMLSDSCRSAAEGTALRQAVSDALHPWVLVAENTTQAPEGTEAPPVFDFELMSPELASEIRGLDPGKRPTPAQARPIVVAFLDCAGWKQKRKSYRHPSEEIQLKVQARVIHVEVGGPGSWRKHPDYLGTQFLLADLALELIEAAKER